MTTSFSETRTTEELLPAESEEEKDDEEEEERAFQNRPYPPRIGIYPHNMHIHTHIHKFNILKSAQSVYLTWKMTNNFPQAAVVNDTFSLFSLLRIAV